MKSRPKQNRNRNSSDSVGNYPDRYHKSCQTPTDEDIRTLVFITDGERALAKDVKTGIQDNSYIEILSGVAEGDRVISAPFSAISKKLSDSTLVEIVKKDDLFSVK